MFWYSMFGLGTIITFPACHFSRWKFKAEWLPMSIVFLSLPNHDLYQNCNPDILRPLNTKGKLYYILVL